ncbi:MAG: exosortase/archaeosortase family protein [Candidatus Melainabacteria bacterium]|nr:exosortase/archaeosortase family protein [Candidatus Melainabacteria bacterium]
MAKLKLVPIELVLLLVAFWHSVHWFVVRTADISDEPWGLVSLATVACFIAASWNSKKSIFSSKQLTVVAVVLMAVYSFSFLVMPPLVRCLIALLTFGVVVWSRTLPEKRNLIALFGLLILSSPLIASLQFFVGFPLRVLVTNVSAAVIQGAGVALSVTGTTFEHQGRMILVDSPCSGINMLWSGFYLCFVLCWIKRLSVFRSLLLCAITFSGVVATNVGRTATLVFVDILNAAGRKFPEFTHDAVGTASFVSLALIIVFVAERLAKTCMSSTNAKITENGETGCETETSATLASSETSAVLMPRAQVFDFKPRKSTLTTVSFAVASVVACLIPFFQAPYHENISKSGESAWPGEFEGCVLKPVKLSSVETKFSSEFPGRIAKFSDGKRTILYRQVNKPTRQLHPSSDCYKGNSFKLRPMAALRDTEGKVWSRFQASKGGRNLEVREIVSDSQGRTWSDTSSWYWSALLGKTQSPWMAVTVATVAN